MKINFTINDELAQKMDSYIADNYLTRSGFISIAINQYLAQEEVTNCLRNMSTGFARLAETGEVPPEFMDELENFQSVVKTLISK